MAHGIQTYIARNYSMGSVTKTVTFQAVSNDDAVKQATKRLPQANGQGQGGRKAAIVGVKRISQ